MRLCFRTTGEPSSPGKSKSGQDELRAVKGKDGKGTPRRPRIEANAKSSASLTGVSNNKGRKPKVKENVKREKGKGLVDTLPDPSSNENDGVPQVEAKEEEDLPPSFRFLRQISGVPFFGTSVQQLGLDKDVVAAAEKGSRNDEDLLTMAYIQSQIGKKSPIPSIKATSVMGLFEVSSFIHPITHNFHQHF